MPSTSKLVEVVVHLVRVLKQFSIAVTPSIPKINKDNLNTLFTAILVILIMHLLPRQGVDVQHWDSISTQDHLAAETHKM